MDRDLMMAEYSAWQRVVRNWHMNTGDINFDDALVNAIKAWGEELAALRIAQPEQVRNRARELNIKEERSIK